MTEIIERLQEMIYTFQENIEKLDELADYFPEFLTESMIKKDSIEEFIDSIKELIADFE